MRSAPPALAAAAALCALGALAHDADIVFLRAERAGDGRVVERLTLTPSTLLWLAPLDADGDGAVSPEELSAGGAAIEAGVWDQSPLASASGPCARGPSAAQLRQTYVELTASFDCPAAEALTQRFRILSVLPPGYRVALGAYGDGGARHAFAERGRETLAVLPAPGSPSPEEGSRGLGGWVALGLEHILLGVDHLAFLLAVLLVGGTWRRTVGLVTSFTAAHSITLGATALGLWTLSPSAAKWVEVAIAASIAWIALENLLLREHRHRAILTFAFGLIHGFGFASALSGYGFGDSAATALFGFNLGVELGQLAVVLALVPLARLLSRTQGGAWAVRLGSVAVLGAGAFWLAERALG